MLLLYRANTYILPVMPTDSIPKVQNHSHQQLDQSESNQIDGPIWIGLSRFGLRLHCMLGRTESTWFDPDG